MFHISALNRCRGGKEPLVDARADAEEGDTCGTDAKGNLSGFIALKRGQWRIGLLDIQSLDDEQTEPKVVNVTGNYNDVHDNGEVKFKG